VLFVVDDMGWMDTGAYGSRYYETPNIDRLAGAGTMFTDAYAASPLCSPTRASILTGKYPARHGITAPAGHLPPHPDDTPPYPDQAEPHRSVIAPFSRRFLDPREHTLSRALHDAGYRTGHFGKWHLGSRTAHWPDRHGFDVSWHAPYPGPPRPLGYFAPYSFRRGTIAPREPGEYLVDHLTDEAIAFIEEDPGRPFFLNAWHFAVHGPWDHKESVTARFARQRDPRGKQGNPIMASMLSSVDESLGRITAKLAELELAERTILVFTSDHGGNVRSNLPGQWRSMGLDERRKSDWLRWAGEQPPTNNDPLREGKGSLYEGGVRIPLIVSWPAAIPAGRRSPAVVSSIDLYPTLVDLLDLEMPAEVRFDGVSLAGVLRDPAKNLEREAVFNFIPHDFDFGRPGVSVRHGDWKLIRWFDAPPGDSPHELYDLRQDIGESTNLASQQPQMMERLDSLIDRFLRETGARLPKPNPAYKP
jgi:arylsulfatase A-like enzyme